MPDSGSRIYKVNSNDELEIVTVTSIEHIQEEVNYYHVVSSQYYNIIANGIITTDGATYLSNLYGFDENIKWPAIREEVISDPDNLYTFEDFADIGLPRKMFDDLRVREAKYLATKYGITLDVFKWYLVSNQLNTDIWLTYCEGSERLKEEYCPAEPETPEEVQPIVTNPPVANVPTNIEEEPSTEEIELDYSKPLGVNTSTYASDESIHSEDNTATGILVGASAAVTILGLLYLATKDKEDDEKEKPLS